MSKKKKDIEVKIEEKQETKGNKVIDFHELSIGKQKIGRVIQNGEKKYSVEISGEQPLNVRSFDEGYEILIRQYNLFNQ